MILLPLLLLSMSLPQEVHSERQALPGPEEIAKLPKDGGQEFNRLVFEQSPYLRQHARNDVDWYAWGPAAFERAKKENKPVFLSIGYSTCHWCHVMEHESFEDAEVAALMNMHFVCVKVDREERPDIDQAYMAVTQAMTGRGGWPMTVVMTPEKKPFFAGTYFPKDSRGGRAGMMQLVPQLSQAWKTQGDKIEETANRIIEHIKSQNTGVRGEAPDVVLLDKAAEELSGRYDPEFGGFGVQPKFPTPHNLRMLLRHHDRTGNADSLNMAVTTLRSMHEGGIWDHVGLGLHRYSTDQEWLVPHFEKMLYDQALYSMACIEAWQVTGDVDLRAAAEETFEYVLRDLRDPSGAFRSAEDADSEGEEGLFYVWTMDELREVLGDQDAFLMATVYGAEEDGNFKDEATGADTGRNILNLSGKVDERLAAAGLKGEGLDERLAKMRRKLFDVREGRIRPFLDDKVLTDWNGLMIAALANGAKAFDDPRYAQAASEAATYVLEHLLTKEGRLLKRSRGGEAGLDAMLEDYAFMIWGLVELYEATGETRWLQAALGLTDQSLAHFWDDEVGGFFLSPDDGEALFVRAKEIYDGAIPSGNAVMALVMGRLARMTGKVELETRAWDVLQGFSRQLHSMASAHSQMLMALDFLAGPSAEVVLVEGSDEEANRKALAALHHSFRPRMVLLRKSPNQAEALGKLAPFTESQTAMGDKATVYVCRDFTCAAPTTDVDVALELLDAPIKVEKN